MEQLIFYFAIIVYFLILSVAVYFSFKTLKAGNMQPEKDLKAIEKAKPCKQRS